MKPQRRRDVARPARQAGIMHKHPRVPKKTTRSWLRAWLAAECTWTMKPRHEAAHSGALTGSA